MWGTYFRRLRSVRNHLKNVNIKMLITTLNYSTWEGDLVRGIKIVVDINSPGRVRTINP